MRQMSLKNYWSTYLFDQSMRDRLIDWPDSEMYGVSGYLNWLSCAKVVLSSLIEDVYRSNILCTDVIIITLRDNN